MDATEHRFTIDQERYQCAEHRQPEHIGRRAIDRIEQPAAAGSQQFAAILLAEHSITRPACVEGAAQRPFGRPVGDGHLAAVGLVTDAYPVQMAQGDRVGIFQGSQHA